MESKVNLTAKRWRLELNMGTLATGGFAANVEMRQEYVPSLTENLPTTNSPAIVGDGIKMAEAAGANLLSMEYIQSLPLGNPKDLPKCWIGGQV